MNKIIEQIYEHPVISFIFISTIFTGVTDIIGAIRGVPISHPGINITKTINRGQ